MLKPKRPARAGKPPTETERLALLVRELALDVAIEETAEGATIRRALRLARAGAPFEEFVAALGVHAKALIRAAEEALKELERERSAATPRPQSRKKRETSQ